MKTLRPTWLLVLAAWTLPLTALAHGDDLASKNGKLGRVLFKTTCTADAQKQIGRAHV